MPLGMVGAVSYILIVILGNLNHQNSIYFLFVDAVELTAKGAPLRALFCTLFAIFIISMLLFFFGMIVKAFRKHYAAVCTGWIMFFITYLLDIFAFPMTQVEMSDSYTQGAEQTIFFFVRVGTTLLLLAACYTLAGGYSKRGNNKFGQMMMVFGIVITSMCFIVPIYVWWGLTVKAAIFFLQFVMIIFSAYYTFTKARLE